MHISDVEKYRNQRDHEMRHGHLSKTDRNEMARPPEYYKYERGEMRHHSEEDNFGGMHGVDPSSHGAELQ
jgi:hypothetical protein